jgi:ABC-2 type transport system permease protein
MCIGITSMVKERSSGSLRVLTAKPLYRRDIIIGKFLGLSLFLLILMVLTEAIFVSLLIMVNGEPDSLLDLLLRLSSFIILMFLNCSFTLGLVMLFGILFNKAEALVLSMAFVSIEWLQQANVDFQFLGQIQQLIDPMKLYFYTIFVYSGNYCMGTLFQTRLSFDAWLSHALPYVALMLAEVVLIVLINSAVFSREEM